MSGEGKWNARYASGEEGERKARCMRVWWALVWGAVCGEEYDLIWMRVATSYITSHQNNVYLNNT